MGMFREPLVFAASMSFLLFTNCAAPAQGVADAQPAATPPQAPAGADAARDGADAKTLALINERCTVCHQTDLIFVQRQSAYNWAMTVQDMTDRGAQLSAAEQETIADYLARHYPE